MKPRERFPLTRTYGEPIKTGLWSGTTGEPLPTELEGYPARLFARLVRYLQRRRRS